MLNNTLDFTTNNINSNSIYQQSPQQQQQQQQIDMDLYHQANDSGIMQNTPSASLCNQTGSINCINTAVNAAASNAAGSLSSTLGNLKPPKTPSRMYSRDRSNHSMSVVYSSSNNNNNNNNNKNSNEPLSSGGGSNFKEHLSRRSGSNNNNNNSYNNNNVSIMDSDAQSLPQGTFAIKAGPQTIMSQWVITLDDGDCDDDEDDEDDDEDEEDDQDQDDHDGHNHHHHHHHERINDHDETAASNRIMTNSGELIDNQNMNNSINNPNNEQIESKWDSVLATPQQHSCPKPPNTTTTPSKTVRSNTQK